MAKHDQKNNHISAVIVVALSVTMIVVCGVSALAHSVRFSNDTVKTITELEANDMSAGAMHDYTYKVSELLQMPDLPAGCELVSLTCMLNAMGYDVDMFTIADEYTIYGDSYVYTYSGSPYWEGMAYPPALTLIGNGYLIEHDQSEHFIEMTGSSFEDLEKKLGRGIPVLVWTTMYMDYPYHTYYEEAGYEYYENEHCVLVWGSDETTVYVMDPLEGLVERERDEFIEIYDDCGRMAVSLGG